MKVKKSIVAIMLPTLIFGGIGVSKIMDVWKTESTKTPAVYTTGEFKGQYNPSDIRGSYSFKDVSKSFDIPVKVLANAFGIEEKEAEMFKNKELETKYGELEHEIGTASVRLFVALYMGLPYDLTGEDTYLLDKGAEILKADCHLTPEQQEYIDSHTVILSKGGR